VEASVKPKSDKPLISIILPIAHNEKLNLINSCLKSLAHQKSNNFELIIVHSNNRHVKQALSRFDFNSIRTFENSLNKSAARNFGAKKAKGDYLLHLDADMELPATLLEKLITKAKTSRAEAVVIPAKSRKKPGFWSKYRQLELDLLVEDPYLETPFFVKKKLFLSIGGFAENLDPIDDWYLQLALKEAGVSFDRISLPIIMNGGLKFKERLRRKYQRGRLIPAFLTRFPKANQPKSSTRLKVLWQGRKKLLSQPHLALALIALKLPETSAFWWGMQRPLKKAEPKINNVYSQTEVATTYDTERLNTNYKRYKHYAEVRSLLELLSKPKHKVLEVGAGTGRVTNELIKRGFAVTPTDISAAMLTEFKKKKGLPSPILTKGSLLPFPSRSFPAVVSMRVIWHILDEKERNKFLEEAIRVSSKDVIIDLANISRSKNILVKTLVSLYTKFFPQGYNVYSETFFFNLKEFKKLQTDKGLKIEKSVPLDIIIPIWLNLLPENLAKAVFPTVFEIDKISAKIIPPTRYLLRISK
jgi:ubiquinone/menaquinone biosynthesis C-methylase UbiE